jgi:hypothetical protein
MALQGSGTIKMSEIIAEKGATAGSSAINISLRGLSVDGIPDYQAAGSVFLIDTPGSPNQVAPYKMSEFYGYAHSLQTVSNVQNYTGNTAAEFVRVTSGSGNIVAGLIEYQLVVRTTTSGSNYVATLYVEETNNGLGTYNGSGMTTGTLYPVQTVTFTQGNWPDSYALDHSVAVTSSGGAVQAGTVLSTGAGETHTFTANWDNTTFELLNPTSSTAGKVRHLTTGECFNGTVIYLDTFIWKFIKSGYPTLTAATFNINNEQDMSFTGQC